MEFMMRGLGIMKEVSSASEKAIIAILLGAAVLAANDAVLKWLTNGYHVGQIMFYRGVFIAPTPKNHTLIQASNDAHTF